MNKVVISSFSISSSPQLSLLHNTIFIINLLHIVSKRRRKNRSVARNSYHDSCYCFWAIWQRCCRCATFEMSQFTSNTRP